MYLSPMKLYLRHGQTDRQTDRGKRIQKDNISCVYLGLDQEDVYKLLMQECEIDADENQLCLCFRQNILGS